MAELDRYHRLIHFIKVYDDILSKQACKDIVDFFNVNVDNHIDSGVEEGRIDTHRKANELNVSILDTEAGIAIHQYLTEASKTVFSMYKRDTEEYSHWMPEFNSVESFRIKHYEHGVGYYNTHIDNVGGREFAVIFYLNNVQRGGETEFPNLHMKVPPKAGRCLIFPTQWQYPHKANIPFINDKYMVQGYIKS